MSHAGEPGPQFPAGQPFSVEPDPQAGDEEAGRMRFKVQIDPSRMTSLHGMTAGELRRMGLLTGHDRIPDCAVLGPSGFEWIALDLTVDSPTAD